MTVVYDALDDVWFVVDEEGYEVAGAFESEGDAWDYIEAWYD